MTFGSLFAGIGGFDSALENSGMKCLWQVEKDESCQSVLKKHWPDVSRFKDVRQFDATRLVQRPDLICGGFPCQDLSVAGRRAGLAGKRSGLFHEFMRIVSELATAFVLIENVPGLLSSNGGRDMGTVCGRLGQLGYGFAYRVLDAQWFGLAQRRKRVFIVGCLGNVRRAAEILFERESLPWDSPPRREARARIAHAVAAGSGGSKFGSGRDGQDDFVTGDIAPCIRASTDSGTQQGCGVQINRIVRRLTPQECERLQGFPDDWTRWGADGKELSDSARYRMLGNAVAVPVAEWIGRRIMENC